MNRPISVEGRQVTGEAADAMRSAILDEIRDVALDRMEDAGGLLRLASRAASTVGSVLGIYGEISNIYDMALAGYEAFTLPRRRVERVAAAHAFGYWVFQNSGLRPPTEMPLGFQREMFASDAADRVSGERQGREDDYSTDGGLSAAAWQNIWGQSARSTISGLQDDLVAKARRGLLTPELREAMGGYESGLAGQPATDLATQYRLMVIAPGFRRDPHIAARSFLLGSLSEEDSHWAREAIIRFWVRFPYTPTTR